MRILEEGQTEQPFFAKVVELDKIEFIKFQDGQHTCLGTWGMKENSVVILVSDKGAIMANIAQAEGRPTQRPDGDSSKENALAMMDMMKDLFRRQQSYFLEGQHNHFAVVICGQTPNVQQRREISRKMYSWMDIQGAFRILQATYDSGTFENVGVVVDGRGRVPKVVLQNNTIPDPYDRSLD